MVLLQPVHPEPSSMEVISKSFKREMLFLKDYAKGFSKFMEIFIALSVTMGNLMLLCCEEGYLPIFLHCSIDSRSLYPPSLKEVPHCFSR